MVFEFLDASLLLVAAALEGRHLLRHGDEALVLHDALDCGETPLEFGQLDEDRVLALRLHQFATAKRQQRRQQQDPVNSQIVHVPSSCT